MVCGRSGGRAGVRAGGRAGASSQSRHIDIAASPSTCFVLLSKNDQRRQSQLMGRIDEQQLLNARVLQPAWDGIFQASRGRAGQA